MTTEHSMEKAKSRLLQAALPHVPFDGWSTTTLNAAIADSQTPPALAHALFPRGGVDLALAYHAAGDAQMIEEITKSDLSTLRFRDRIAAAIKLRLKHSDRELVRRGTSLLALPPYAPEGTKALWSTADAIWNALGDTSDDVNWYTKRASLSAVYAATVLFWLGDDSPDHHASWTFLDRRIENVMSFEKLKAGFRENPLGKALLSGPLRVLERVHAPKRADDLPGKF